MSKDRVWRGLGVIPPKYCMCTGYKRGSAPLSLLVFTNQRHRTLVRRPFLPPSLLSSPTCHNARRSLCSGGFIGSVFLRQQQQQIGKLPVSFLPSLFFLSRSHSHSLSQSCSPISGVHRGFTATSSIIFLPAVKDTTGGSPSNAQHVRRSSTLLQPVVPLPFGKCFLP